MYPRQDLIQTLTPGKTYKILDKNDIILDTDLYRSYVEGRPKGWQTANYTITYWIGKTVNSFAQSVYKLDNSSDYPKWFEIIRDISMTIKI